ncbi:uncharacterized protein EKO05_0010556 [Ascochyta rabiei]|uniref:uncharacterized protein n=1 Tax=Didymella rabiei TaxID=5454 RepID=UPI0019014A96|nr:uncharacterized protein EKO05_0010556 [Ascochyta rabiei]UPX20320.1 hypothetical protein EKO05_0010556 [Ascochyta rabiei]
MPKTMPKTMPILLSRNDTSPNGTVAVIIFIAGAIILVLCIILALLFFKNRRAAHRGSSSGGKAFIPRLERGSGNSESRGVGKYGKLEDDEEGAWSAEMESEGGLERERKGGYAPVHDESMGYQSQTLHHGQPDKDTYR